MTIDPNDPRLTHYALGELDERERAAVEAALADSPDARRTVDEIRQTADLLTAELTSEPIPTLSADQRRIIEHKIAQSTQSNPTRSRAWIRYGIPTALAASVLAFFGVRSLLLPTLSRSSENRTPISTFAFRMPLASGPVLDEQSESAPQFASERVKNSPTLSRARELSQRLASKKSKARELDPATLAKLQSMGYLGGAAAPARLSRIGSGRRLARGENEGVLSLYEHGPFSAGDFWELFGVADDDTFEDTGLVTEVYDRIVDNPFLPVAQDPLSTFSIDVDTASYANIRRFLNQGAMPPKDAVRIEEMVNYFSYDYPPPTGDEPFSVDVEIAEAPWQPDHRLARIGLKGWEIEEYGRPPANLVFLLDVSGSMRSGNKLPLLKRSMKMLAGQLTEDDQVAIVVYAGASGLVLPSTACDDQRAILGALDNLHAGGSTNGGAGIQLAYDIAEEYFIEGGVNRVILATDGDFNVGISNQGDLIRLIEEKAKSGVFLTVLGFGMGNYKDSTLEKLADKGNGNYAYIDTINEAQKTLVDQFGGTMVTIAKDVKIQVEFNPAAVSAYRLIGYENRILAARDFNDDTKDAGEIGAGHTVTALYEIVPAGIEIDLPGVDPLKYQTPAETTSTADSGELMTIKLRYKQPDGDTSELLEFPITDEGLSIEDATDDFAFAAAVASFGMLLRESPYIEDWTFDAVVELAQPNLGEDPHGYRTEFLDLVEKASEIQDQ